MTVICCARTLRVLWRRRLIKIDPTAVYGRGVVGFGVQGEAGAEGVGRATAQRNDDRLSLLVNAADGQGTLP